MSKLLNLETGEWEEVSKEIFDKRVDKAAKIARENIKTGSTTKFDSASEAIEYLNRDNDKENNS